MKAGLPLMGNGLQTLAKSVLIPIGLRAGASTLDTGIHKKIFSNGMRTLIIANR